MIKVGTLVRVNYPEYAAGLRGRIQAQEISGRWIIELEENPLADSDEPLLLSLDETEFEIIEQ